MKTNRLNVACLAAATMIFSASQAALAEDEAEATWKISGWINEGLSYYDDSEGTDAVQLSDNGTTLGSRITLSGSYKPPKTSLTAGFEVIVEPLSGTPNFAGGGQTTPLLFANQDNLDTFNGGDIGVLGSSVNIGGNWGKVTLGLQSMPTDNIAVLADPSVTIWSGISPLFRANGFFIRGVDAAVADTTWGSFAQCLGTPGLGIGIDCNGIYRNGVRYDLPAFGPVSIAIGYANDDIYDIALKYAGEIGSLKANLNVGYSYNSDGGTNVGADSGTDTFQVQGGLMDTGTGLFGVISYQIEEASGSTIAGSGDETDAYYLKGGIKTPWSDIGDTALYVEYGIYNDQYGAAEGVSGSELERVGFVAEQYFGTRLIIYGKWEQYSVDVEGTAAAEALYSGAEDLSLATLGVTYHF